jgi:copper chaperone CopZ
VCAHAVRVAIRKLEGVESVEVSLERATADIRFRPANRITLAQLRQIIRNNGFSAREAIVTAVGTLVERNGKPALSIDGTSTVFLLTTTGPQNAAYAEALQRVTSKQTGRVEAVGTVARPADPNEPEELAIQSVRSAPAAATPR